MHRASHLKLAFATPFVPALLAAQTPTVHVLPATPSTVAYGYYWSEAEPVLRIASGDIVATIYQLMGVDPHMTVNDLSGRPVHIAHGGEPIWDVIA